jgi:hypothetical protein
MTRRIVLAAAGSACLLAAIALALLGRAVLATPAAVSEASLDWPGNARVAGDRGLAEREAARLLAADRVELLLRFVRAYRQATAQPALAMSAVKPVRLARLIPRLPSARERAQAHLMVGAIFALPAGNGTVSFDLIRQAGNGVLLRQAAQEFRAAVLADDRSEDAKYDLELLLKPQAESRPAERRPGDGKADKRVKGKPSRRKTRDRASHSNLEQHHAGIYSTGSGY